MLEDSYEFYESQTAYLKCGAVVSADISEIQWYFNEDQRLQTDQSKRF